MSVTDTATDLDAAFGLILGVLLGVSFWAVVIRIVESMWPRAMQIGNR